MGQLSSAYSYIRDKYEQMQFTSRISQQQKLVSCSATKSLNLQNVVHRVEFLQRVDLVDCQVLNLSNNRIRDLSVFGRMKLDNVIILNLRENRIGSLESFRGARTQRMSMIELDKNQLTSLEYLDKLDLSSLGRLDICNNHISDISTLPRCNLISLGILNLSNNNICQIKPLRRCHHFSKLLYLYLKNNELCNIIDLIPILTVLRSVSVVRVNGNFVAASQRKFVRGFRIRNINGGDVAIYT